MVQVDHLTKTFHSGRGQVAVLRDISFTVPEAVAAAVVGTSGSGKTTLLNCIGGLERPDEGNIRCFGNNIESFSTKSLGRYQRREVGFIFQQGNLLSYLTVFQNIAFPLVLNGMDTKGIAARVTHLLERIGLPAAQKAMPHELSGGEMQRVSAARAMAHAPKLLLADEPTASLDSETARKLVRLLLDMGREKHCTLLIATHDPVVFNLADQVIHLKDGKILKKEKK